MPLSDDHAPERIQAGSIASAMAPGVQRMGQCNPPEPSGAISSTNPAISQIAAKFIKRDRILAEDGVSENNRRAKFYRLTAKGPQATACRNHKMGELARAIAGILRPAGGEHGKA
jgi:DNA-binding MarR family transcriptional regulator